MNHILITEENADDFSPLLPPGYSPAEDRIAIGAYNDKGYMAGTISLKQVDYEYDIDWLYVSPSFRRKGVGTGLIKEAVNMIDETGVVPFTARFEATPEDDGILWFFRSLNLDTHIIDVS